MTCIKCAPSDIVDYLAQIKNAKITRILPCYVTIGRYTYPAARYWETLMSPEGSQAWHRGEREYTREMIWCNGMLPSYNLRGNVAYVVRDVDGRTSQDWYVAAYYGFIKNRQQERKQPNEFNPWGNSFLLAPWSVPDGTAIDQHARTPYRRVAMHIGL